jgi:hypothetical protein
MSVVGWLSELGSPGAGSSRALERWVAPGVVAALLLGVPAAADESDWRLFSPPGGGFHIEMPGVPRRESQEHLTPGGSVRETSWWLAVDGAELAVETHDLPALATLLMSEASLLDRARDGVVENDGGELLSSESVVLQGAPARVFTWRYPGEPVRLERGLTLLVGERIYLLTGTGADPAAHPAVTRFFDSFRLATERSRQQPD